MSATKALRSALVLIAMLALSGCGESDDKPYLTFLGGGFIFNYRIGDAYYGFVVKAERRLPDGSVIEAEFEDPSGGKPIVVRQKALFGRSEYLFRTPPLHGVKKGKAYHVTVRLRRAEARPVIATYRRSYRSSVSQAELPKVQPGVTDCGPAGKRQTTACVTGR